VKLISGESLGFTQNYTDPLMNDTTCRKQIDIVAGHLYGHAPLEYMKKSAVLATKYGKEVWMTEHSCTDNIDHLPTWHENLIFAEELNECMLAGCTGYIYWYMRAHWAFVGTGESKYGTGNKKNYLLPRAYVLSHFAKNVTGSTRLTTNRDKATGEGAGLEYSAYIKGDSSLIVMAIDTTKNAHDLELRLPAKVNSYIYLKSIGNEKENLCQRDTIYLDEPTDVINVPLPAHSLNTYILNIDKGTTAIEPLKLEDDALTPKTYYDLQGRRLESPSGLCIERSANGRSRKIFFK
jgi:glucuronoarabinoxylan endo-1,4-beta-xylanase